MLKPIAIYGAGGLGVEILSTIEAINSVKVCWEILGFYDDDPDKVVPEGYERLGGMQELTSCPSDFNLIIGIAGILEKKELVDKLINYSIKLASIVHPTAILSRSISLGNNCYLGPYSYIGPNSIIGDHVYLGNHCSVGHDVLISDFCSIMPASVLAGNTVIKEYSMIGTGAKVLQGRIVNKNSTVGAGALVTKDTEKYSTVAGVPARVRS